MATVSKRIKRHHERVSRTNLRPLDEALAIVKEMAGTKFRESVDVAINLGIDASKSDQAVRGSTVLPNGTGKQVRVAVFAQGDNAAKAKAAGADVVGFEDLAERIKGGEMNFDTVIATPDAMRVVGQLGRVLGPRGLMPNPKVGTVTTDVETAVRNAKSGQVRYRTDKAGIVHCPIGKADFEVQGAAREPDGAAPRHQEGATAAREGAVPQAPDRFFHDGPRRRGGPGLDRGGAGVSQAHFAPGRRDAAAEREEKAAARAAAVEDRRCPRATWNGDLMGRRACQRRRCKPSQIFLVRSPSESPTREGRRDPREPGWLQGSR